MTLNDVGGNGKGAGSHIQNYPDVRMDGDIDVDHVSASTEVVKMGSSGMRSVATTIKLGLAGLDGNTPLW